jgi:hypothetical protein
MKDKSAYGYYIYNGIDRLNKNKGYIIQNCVSCCKICNRAKSDMTYNKWLKYLKNLKNYILINEKGE